MNWHSQEIERIWSALHSSPAGLDAASVAQKQEEYGLNQLDSKKKKPAWMLFLL